ncbi:hypothetical protein Tco_0640423 [Tanacetum coccineum]
MTNKKMRNSTAYKTYLDYATGVKSTKIARKFKKPASPSKRKALVPVEEEHEPTKKKKTPVQVDKSVGIDLLSYIAALEVAQMMKVLKRSSQESSIHQASSSGPKEESFDTNSKAKT